MSQSLQMNSGSAFTDSKPKKSPKSSPLWGVKEDAHHMLGGLKEVLKAAASCGETTTQQHMCCTQNGHSSNYIQHNTKVPAVEQEIYACGCIPADAEASSRESESESEPGRLTGAPGAAGKESLVAIQVPLGACQWTSMGSESPEVMPAFHTLKIMYRSQTKGTMCCVGCKPQVTSRQGCSYRRGYSFHSQMSWTQGSQIAWS